jgi:pullulanase/glycogen debranching enzyme
VIEPALEAEVERLRQALTRIGNMPNGNAEWNEEYRQGYDKAMSRVRAEVARYAPDRTEEP